MGIFKKTPRPETFEDYVAYFDSLPAERRNIYLKYFESFNELNNALFTSYAEMTDFYDYEGYRLDCIAKKMKAPRGEGLNIYSFLSKFYGFHHVESLKRELVRGNGEFAFNLIRLRNKPEYFQDEMLYFTINPNKTHNERSDMLSIIASNKKDYAEGNNTFFYIEENSETVYNVNQYWDESTKGIDDINKAGKYISSILDLMKQFSCHTIELTEEKDKVEVWNRLLDEAKELSKSKPETTTETTTETNRDKKQ